MDPDSTAVGTTRTLPSGSLMGRSSLALSRVVSVIVIVSGCSRLTRCFNLRRAYWLGCWSRGTWRAGVTRYFIQAAAARITHNVPGCCSGCCLDCNVNKIDPSSYRHSFTPLCCRAAGVPIAFALEPIAVALARTLTGTGLSSSAQTMEQFAVLGLAGTVPRGLDGSIAM